MSHYVELYIASDESYMQFAESIEAILGVILEPDPEPLTSSILFRYSDKEHIWFDIIEHTLMNEEGLNFGNYSATPHLHTL